MANQTYLITGAGTGLGRGAAFGLAGQGKTVIAAVETPAQEAGLKAEAAEQKRQLQVVKLDITDPADRAKAAEWDVDVLVNNAGVAHAGSLLDIPENILREQFEVNVFGTILLTQIVGRRMVRKRSGRIVFVSSVHGLIADPFHGPYCGSKYALEAFGEALAKELQEFNVQVQMINPGPYLTGFNDREYESYKRWETDPETWLFPYELQSFPYEQLDPEGAIDEMVKILLEEKGDFRNVFPKPMSVLARKRRDDLWDRKTDADLGEVNDMIELSRKMEPATKPAEGIITRIKDKLS